MKKSKPTCGCERRGSRVFECAYHTGMHDGEDLAVAAIVAFAETHMAEYMVPAKFLAAIECGEHRKGGK